MSEPTVLGEDELCVIAVIRPAMTKPSSATWHCSLSMHHLNDEDVGWASVAAADAGPASAAASSSSRAAPTKKRPGRPRKIPDHVVPHAAGHDVSVAPAVPSDVKPEVCATGKDSGRVVQAVWKAGQRILCRIGSLFQSRLWEVLNSEFRTRAGEPAQANARPAAEAPDSDSDDNPAKVLLTGTSILKVSVQQRVSGGKYLKSQQVLGRNEKRVACCVLNFAGLFTGFMMAKCCEKSSAPDSAWQIAALIKRRRYDETPTKLALKETDGNQSWQELGKKHATAQVAKVFQTELACGVVMYNSRTHEACLMKTTLPTMMACVDAATAENIRRVQLESESIVGSMDRFAEQAGRVFNIPVTDRASSNIKAERDISGARSNCINSHFLCWIHKASQIQNRQFSQTDSHVSGLLHCSLSQRGGGCRSTLRSILYQIIEERLQILLGDPPAKFTARCDAVLSLWLGYDIGSLAYRRK